MRSHEILKATKSPIQAVLLCLLVLTSCTKEQSRIVDHPRLTSAVTMQDVRFLSPSLQREMTYRVILPANYSSMGRKLPVLYLLHGGGGGDFRDWTNYSDVAQYAAKGFILVMPEGNESYYVNSATNPQGRYEDYIIKDLISDVEQRFPAAQTPDQRAILGVSMGGFGAVVLGLKHPELFAFVGAMSPAIDVPSRPFSIKRISQWRHFRAIFGDWKGQHQHENDPYVLVRSGDVSKAPYFFLTCGDKEGLLPANRKFDSLLQQHHFQHEFHVVPGGHDWNQWSAEFPELYRALYHHLGAAANVRIR
ncbi:MAG TPA: alpha/beta hydrolase family protein [Candidatus Angelobacter sp.]|nr:alpha/beta hydrolase family protein [Candidatus Angelobacter sp.]